jgi:hypothetical protein
MTSAFVITKEEVEIIEDSLQNDHCRKCPYEGGGIKSGIKAFIRSRPVHSDVLDERIKDIELIIALCKKLRHHFPDDLSLQMTQEQHAKELKKIESLKRSLEGEINGQRY